MENVSPIITAKNLNLWYGDFKALKDISLDMGEREITALIGPSGCGKSTFLKTLNRMNDLVPGIRIEGDVRLKGQDIFAREMQPTELRRRVGMVFQKANPFPMSIYDNITYGPPEKERAGPFRRPAAAPVHCPRPGCQARSPADG